MIDESCGSRSRASSKDPRICSGYRRLLSGRQLPEYLVDIRQHALLAAIIRHCLHTRITLEHVNAIISTVLRTMPGSLHHAIASLSLGRASANHSLESKLLAAATAGIEGIEVFYEDLEVYASRLPPDNRHLDPNASILAAAAHFRQLASTNNLTIISLQPFLHYEGLLSSTERDARRQKLRLWFQIVHVLEIDIIQVPSNFLPKEELTGDFATSVSDLQWLADEGAKQDRPVRFAYENICWGTFVNTWKQMWDVVVAVDRENFGLLLDTFHLCGGEWANPAADDGTVGEGADEKFEQSMKQMAKTIDVKKVFYVQVADAEKAVPAMRKELGNKWWVDGQPERMMWSRNLRTFGFEGEGYMPVDVALKAILARPPEGLGYEGWVSHEVFSWSLMEEDEGVPEKHARRAKESWKKLQARFSPGG